MIEYDAAEGGVCADFRNLLGGRWMERVVLLGGS